MDLLGILCISTFIRIKSITERNIIDLRIHVEIPVHSANSHSFQFHRTFHSMSQYSDLAEEELAAAALQDEAQNQ